MSYPGGHLQNARTLTSAELAEAARLQLDYAVERAARRPFIQRNAKDAGKTARDRALATPGPERDYVVHLEKAGRVQRHEQELEASKRKTTAVRKRGESETKNRALKPGQARSPHAPKRQRTTEPDAGPVTGADADRVAEEARQRAAAAPAGTAFASPSPPRATGNDLVPYSPSPEAPTAAALYEERRAARERRIKARTVFVVKTVVHGIRSGIALTTSEKRQIACHVRATHEGIQAGSGSTARAFSTRAGSQFYRRFRPDPCDLLARAQEYADLLVDSLTIEQTTDAERSHGSDNADNDPTFEQARDYHHAWLVENGFNPAESGYRSADEDEDILDF